MIEQFKENLKIVKTSNKMYYSRAMALVMSKRFVNDKYAKEFIEFYGDKEIYETRKKELENEAQK